MRQIPLPPLPSGQSRSSRDLQGAAQSKRRSFFGKAVRGVRWLSSTPKHWFGHEHVRGGARLIGGLATKLRSREQRAHRFHTADEGAFDLQATAFSYGMSEPELRRRLALRRRQTAWNAYILSGICVLFFGGWLYKVLDATTVAHRVVLVVDFLPFCVLFGLLGFYQGLLNWQIRTERTGGWLEFLRTDNGFLPRP